MQKIPKLYDSHMHLLNFQILPERVLERWDVPESLIIKASEKLKDYDYIIDLMENIYNLFAEKDIDIQPILDHYVSEISDNLDRIEHELDDAGIDYANILLLDLEPSWGSNRELAREEVHQILMKEKENRPWMRIFMGVNLLRTQENIIKNLKDHDFDGIKIYPKLRGNKPSLIHRKLFKYCEENEIPIVTHCSKGGIGTATDNADPSHWFDILWEFPKLKVCFAHHGRGSSRWRQVILSLMQEFQNVFADVSFDSAAIHDPRGYFRKLRALMDCQPASFIFGSDYPLHIMQYTYSDLVRAYRKNLGEELFQILFGINAERFNEKKEHNDNDKQISN